MNRTPVTSSNVASVGYDPYEQTLEVEFLPAVDGTRSVWRYVPISREMYAAMFGEGQSIGASVAQLKADPDVRAQHVEDLAPEPVTSSSPEPEAPHE